MAVRGKFLFAAALSGFFAAAIGGPADPPSAAVLGEARLIVQRMIDNPRGPYSRVLWYCNDGTVQPPVPYACRERGGGRQHAEFSAERQRLAELGWNVGTIFAPLTFRDLNDALPRARRLRELPLERYLIDIDDGWVLRRAQGYRGRVQIEDEIAAGRNILLDAMADPHWLERHYLLVRELVRVIPHDHDSDIARRVRRSAIELAELDPAAERWRAEIHSTPSRSTAVRLRQWAKSRGAPQVVQFAEALADDLDLLYGDRGREARLQDRMQQLRGPEAGPWRENVATALKLDGAPRIGALCRSVARARDELLPTLDKGNRLAVFDLLGSLETEIALTFSAVNRETITRAGVLSMAASLLRCAYGAGLLSRHELASATRPLAEGADEVTLEQYLAAIESLKRVPGWALGTVRHTFAKALANYVALDPRAARFTDDLLRESALLAFGELLKLLAQDAARLTGRQTEIAGRLVGGAIALNSGLARGRLRIYRTLAAVDATPPAVGDIVALPETIAELNPVAGILTLGEGNPLSHVQLLARNFGIPNVAIDASTVELLEPLENREVILAVGRSGDFILRAADDAGDLNEFFNRPAGPAPGEQITVSRPDLDRRSILHLHQIDRSLSGRVVGPKAANLGELNRLFPGRVAPALAIPFGIYASQLEEYGLRRAIVDAYAGHAAGKLDQAQLDAELARIRESIAVLQLSADIRSRLVDAMKEEFGAPDSYGVFIRSDTNVEDLPQFTGAGLSETVPHVVGIDAQLKSIPRVWASVLSPRALAWRSSLLTNPEEIYASVLIMKSVASDKSGVLVTTNLAMPDKPGLTVSTGWGVGGAVAGEAAETLVLLPNEREYLVSESKAAYRRVLAPAGGVDWRPAEMGRVLTSGEVAQLRQLAREVDERYVPVKDERGNRRPWDIEFGFVNGELTLFQIRPLVERKAERAELVLARALKKTRPASQARFVDLSLPIGVTAP